MKGCHNCKYNGKVFVSYEHSPCADCRAKDTPPPLGGIPIEDIYCAAEASVEHPAIITDHVS